VAKIATTVTQKAVLFCCGEEHPVTVRGELAARWQRDLFGGIEIERCSFELRPASQTITCRTCKETYQVAAADVRYLSGLLLADQTGQEACFHISREGEARSADTIIKDAIKAKMAQGCFR